MILHAGDPAPDPVVYDGNAVPTRISATWAGGAVVLVFARHFG